ncbi:MAG: hypothetical protein Q9160_005597 [Pyrenula sp. 1 TL-2023]
MERPRGNINDKTTRPFQSPKQKGSSDLPESFPAEPHGMENSGVSSSVLHQKEKAAESEKSRPIKNASGGQNSAKRSRDSPELSGTETPHENHLSSHHGRVVSSSGPLSAVGGTPPAKRTPKNTSPMELQEANELARSLSQEPKKIESAKDAKKVPENVRKDFEYWLKERPRSERRVEKKIEKLTTKTRHFRVFLGPPVEPAEFRTQETRQIMEPLECTPAQLGLPIEDGDKPRYLKILRAPDNCHPELGFIVTHDKNHKSSKHFVKEKANGSLERSDQVSPSPVTNQPDNSGPHFPDTTPDRQSEAASLNAGQLEGSDACLSDDLQPSVDASRSNADQPESSDARLSDGPQPLNDDSPSNGRQPESSDDCSPGKPGLHPDASQVLPIEYQFFREENGKDLMAGRASDEECPILEFLIANGVSLELFTLDESRRGKIPMFVNVVNASQGSVYIRGMDEAKFIEVLSKIEEVK